MAYDYNKVIPSSWGNYFEVRQMCGHSGFMKDPAKAQNPQGASATKWTLIGSDADRVVSAASATSMDAAHAFRYWHRPPDAKTGTACKPFDNNADGDFDHEDYLRGDSQNAGGVADSLSPDSCFMWSYDVHQNSRTWKFHDNGFRPVRLNVFEAET